MPIKWDKKSIELIKNRNLSAKELSEMLGTTPHAIYQKRSKIGIRFHKDYSRRKRPWPSSKWPRALKWYKRNGFLQKNPRCVYCGDYSECIDHFIPVSKGGSDHLANLMASCLTCNMKKSDHIGLDWLLKDDKYGL